MSVVSLSRFSASLASCHTLSRRLPLSAFNQWRNACQAGGWEIRCEGKETRAGCPLELSAEQERDAAGEEEFRRG
jgi:hypothetical protein